jgi:hypothetical protein
MLILDLQQHTASQQLDSSRTPPRRFAPAARPPRVRARRSTPHSPSRGSAGAPRGRASSRTLILVPARGRQWELSPHCTHHRPCNQTAATVTRGPRGPGADLWTARRACGVACAFAGPRGSAPRCCPAVRRDGHNYASQRCRVRELRQRHDGRRCLAPLALSMLDSAGGAVASPPKQELRGTASCSGTPVARPARASRAPARSARSSRSASVAFASPYARYGPATGRFAYSPLALGGSISNFMLEGSIASSRR